MTKINWCWLSPTGYLHAQNPYLSRGGTACGVHKPCSGNGWRYLPIVKHMNLPKCKNCLRVYERLERLEKKWGQP